jgi:hypothetical protein
MNGKRKRAARALALVLALTGAIALAALALSGGESTTPAAEAGDPVGGEVESEEADVEGRDAFLTPRQLPGEKIVSADLEAAFAAANAIEAQTVRELPGLLDPQWSLAGPTNVGGRVTDIAPDPTQAGRVYVGVATAGVWKSEDGGVTLENTWPNDFPQAIGAVTVDQNGVVYVGTGEVNPGGGSLSYGGNGLYRSTDQGATWRHIGLGDSVSTIGAIRVDPTNADRIYVAAAGSLFAAGGVRGVYRSTDGGATWTRVLAGLNQFTGATDLAMDPTNPNKIFAPMWDHHREWLCRCYAGPGTGIYLTTDGGNSWRRLENDRITSFTPGDTIGFASSTSTTDTAQARMGVAIAPNNPNRVYVTTGNWSQTTAGGGQTARGFRGFYRSDDGGQTFQTMTSANPGGDTVWTSKIWIDPVNADVLYVAGVSLRRSIDGGATWGNVTSLHVDHHAAAWDPTTPGRFYEGNDGGFYRSTANGANGTWTQTFPAPWTQFYSVDVSELDPQRVVGGTQDNGCRRSWNNAGVASPDGWTSTLGCGDGENMLIDYLNQNNIYGCSQFGFCRRSTNAGNNSSGFGATTSDRRNWQTPIALDPNNPAVVYYGGNILNRSTDMAQTFTAISPSLSNPASSTDPAYPFGTLTAVGIAKTDPNVIYAGTDDGWLWGTQDGGANWARFTDPALPDRWVTRVTVDPRAANVVYVTYSGYRNVDGNAHVLRSIDSGAQWIDITGNLPGAPTQDVLVDPENTNRVFVATDVGVFTANVGKAKSKAQASSINWYQLGSGLPRAPVNDLRYHVPTHTLYAATYGRGVWKLEVVRND